ncbi:Protein unc-79 like [Schistosoma japonicum]|nr:Protein unc-79 like [Schistosoma japonicum]
MTNFKSHAYGTKLKALNDICSKLVNNASNLPSSNDVTSLLKFFQNSLHNILKDIQTLSVERFMNRTNDEEWRSKYLPKFDYGTLYLCILTISEHIQKLTNQNAVCEHLLRTVQCLIFCLDYDCLEGVPLAITWMLLYFPSNMQSGVMDLLCSVAIPLIYNMSDDQESYAIDCIPSILTLVFQHAEKVEYHVWVLESFMSKKKDLYKDLLMISAYGPTEARLPAVCLFFHYWPENYPTAFHGNQVLQPIHYAWEAWKPITCYRNDCPNKTGKALAMKMTVNPKVSIQQSGKPPPLYVCLDCADALNRLDFDQFIDVLLPTKQISLTCESKTCRSKNNSASFTCWSSSCTYLTGNRAIRLCELCHTIRHIYPDINQSSTDRNKKLTDKNVLQETLDTTTSTTSFEVTNTTGQNNNDSHENDHSMTHIYQSSLPDVWDMSIDAQPCMVQAIISLTSETMPRWRQVLLGGVETGDESTNRAVAGLACPGPTAPGGPTSSNEMVMLGLSGGSMITPNLSNNPVNSTNTVQVGGSTIGQTGFSDFGTGQVIGTVGRNQTAIGSGAASGGIAGINGPVNSTGTETGAITLLGRYRDEDHRVLAIYGAFLVGEKCRPRERINLELLTRITAGIFNWFLDTIYTAEASITFDGHGNLRQRYELGDLLERIKSEYILKWIQEVYRLHPEAVYAVLLPHPLQYARVGSCWDAISDHLSRIKHGLSRIGSLIPYDIITFETWDFVMPYWLESIRTEVPRADYPELEILLKKIFDATAGPFPFLPQKVYHFASERFVNTPVSVQDQALSWLEILTIVEVPIPMKELLTMFAAGVASLFLELLLPTTDETDDEYLTDQDEYDDSLGQNTVSEVDWLNENGISSENVDHNTTGEDHLLDGDENDLFPDDSRGDDDENVDRNPAPLDNRLSLDENNYIEEGDEDDDDDDPTLDETKNLLSGNLDEKNTLKSLASNAQRKSDKHYRTKHIPVTESNIRLSMSSSLIPESNLESQKLLSSSNVKTDVSLQNKTTVQQNIIDKASKPHQFSDFEINDAHDSTADLVVKKHGSQISQYRVTACLTQMLDIAYRQLKILDPIGHSGYTQETPQLLLWLLGDMLELYWGNVAETADHATSPGLRNLYCLGLETCILPKSKTKLPNTSKPQISTNSALTTDANNDNQVNMNKQIEGTSECIDCLDMLTWFNHARLICQYLAPVRPTPKVTVDFTVNELKSVVDFPEYTDWKDSGNSEASGVKSSDPTTNLSEVTEKLPSSEDLCSIPPVLRLIYLLTRFVKEGSRRYIESENVNDRSEGLFRDNTTSATATDERPMFPPSSSSTDQITIELKAFRDPVVLQCILECLAYLFHTGDALRQILTKADKDEQKLSSTSFSSSASVLVNAVTAGGVNTGGVTNIASSTTMGTIGANSLIGLTGNKLTSQIASQDLSNKGQLIQTTKTLTSRNCTATPRAQKNFVYYLIHSHLIPSFWSLLKSELSYLASWTVPLILHCLSFPGGFNVFWKLVERDFAHHDWRIRFDAVEKVSVLLRELDYCTLASGFSGSAGNKLNHLLSGGSMASSGAINVFSRLTGVTNMGRSKLNSGRKNIPNSQTTKQHGGGTNPELVNKSSNNRHPLIQSAIAHAFCCLIGSLDDPNSMLAQYTSVQLASLHNISLACAIQCLEFQFDTVISDRCLILQRMHQLSCNLPNRQIFTWDFFVNRSSLLAIQAQLGNTPGRVDIDSVTDLSGSHRASEHFQNQFERAAFAIHKTSGIKSISLNSQAYSLRFSPHSGGSFGLTQESQKTNQYSLLSNSSSPGHIPDEYKYENDGQKQPSTQIGSDPTMLDGVQRSHFKFGHGARRSRPSISSVCGLLTGGLPSSEFVDSNNKFLSSIQQALDLDGNERDTLHQWVRLLLKFMSTVQLDLKMDESGTGGVSNTDSGDGGIGSGIGSNTSGSSSGRHNIANKSRDELKDRKALSKAQRHLAFLLGYTNGSFDIPPHKMRNSTVFHAFLAHVAGVLDRNFSMGCCILHQTLVVLQFCPSPQRYATDTQPPTFTLRLLEPQVRLHWLQTLLVILYKYEYNTPGGNLVGNTNISSGISYSSSAVTSHTSNPTTNSATSGGTFTGNTSSNSSSRMHKRSSECEPQLQLDNPTGNPPTITSSGGSNRPNPGGGNFNSNSGSGSGGGNITNTSGSYQFTPSNLLGSGGGNTNILSSPSNPVGGTRGMIEYLIQIVLNTLDSHVHICRVRPNDELVTPFNSQLRLREASNVSADFNPILETVTLPATPIQEEYDDEDTVIMPGVTINLLPTTNGSNGKSYSEVGIANQQQLSSLDETADNIIYMTKKTNKEQVGAYQNDKQSENEANLFDDVGDDVDGRRDRPKRNSFDLLSGSSLSHKHFGSKKAITSKSVMSMNKRIHKGQHLSTDTLISHKANLNDQKNEAKQSTTSVDPCTLTQNEQSIITPLLMDSELSTVPEITESTKVQTCEEQIKKESTDCKSPKRVTLKFSKRGSTTIFQDEKKSKLIGTDSAGHNKRIQQLDSLSDSVHQMNKNKHSNNQLIKSNNSTASNSSHPLEAGDDTISHNNTSVRDSSNSKSSMVDRSRSVADGLCSFEGTKLDKKLENAKKHSSIPSCSLSVTSTTANTSLNTTSINVQSHMSSANTLPNLTAAAMTMALTTERCPWCQCILEQYDENTIGLGILCLATFVHREPSLAAPYLRDMLLITARLANAYFYSWQPELTHVISPGNVASIAHQFLRCTMYNLAPNGLFTQLFQTHITDENFFRTIISVLVDFEDHMSIFQPVALLLESLNKQKSINLDTLPILLENLANYLEHLPNLTDDSKLNHFIASGWTDIIGPLDLFLRKLATVTPIPNNLATTVRIMTYVLRSPAASNFKTLSDTFSNLLRVIVENVHFRLTSVIELCSLSNRVLKDRSKAQLSRTIVDMFYQFIKFRACIPDENLIKLLQFILMDAGGTIEPNQVVEGITTLFNPQTYHLFPTGVAELMRPHLPDCLVFISDIHTMHKIKQSQKSVVQLNSIGYGLNSFMIPGSNSCGAGNLDSNILAGGGGFTSSGVPNSGPAATGTSSNVGVGATIPSLHEDVLGAHLKSGIAQYVSLELSRSNSGSDLDVLPSLAPGLLSDIKTTRNNKNTGPGLPIRSKAVTTVPGLNTTSIGLPRKDSNLLSETGHTGNVEQASTQVKLNKTSGSFVKQNENHADPAIIVITQPDVNSPSDCKFSETDNTYLTTTVTTQMSLSKRQEVTSPKLLCSTLSSPSPVTSHDQAPSTSNNNINSNSSATTCTSNIPSINSVSPSISATSQATSSSNVPNPRHPNYAHLVLSSTCSHTGNAEAPILQYLPWLKSTPPSSQLGPKDFLIMVERIRTLSWLLLGATMNMALTREATGLLCRPIPFNLVVSVADLVKALLSGFPDQQKQSVTVMSSLYHVFLLCQVWTIYCETIASFSPVNSNQHKAAMATAFDFWIRIMPTIIRLLSISEDFVIVSGRLLTVIEELIECQSSLVSKLFTLWMPLLHGRHRQLPGNMLKRLQKCIEWEPPEPYNRLLLLLSLPDPLSNSRLLSPGSTAGHHENLSIPINGAGTMASSSSHEKALIHSTSSSLPGWTESSLLACQGNALMGCNLISKSPKECLTEGVNFTGNAQCIGHALAPSAPFANDGTADGVGLGAGAMGSDLLTSRLVAWLKKHIFVLGRNEDQHSTATHIFVH